jgi:hypothetical protein
MGRSRHIFPLILEGNKTEVTGASSWDGTSGYIQFAGTSSYTFTVGDPVHSGTVLIFHKESDSGTVTIDLTNDYNSDYPNLSLVEQDQIALVMFNKDVGGWIVISNETLGTDSTTSAATWNITNTFTLGRAASVTQLTDRTTAVTQNTQDPVYLVTTNNASLADGASATFTFNCTSVDNDDVFVANCINEPNIDVYISNRQDDAFDITVTNRTGSATTTAHEIQIIRIN